MSTSAVGACAKAGNGNKTAENVLQLADLRRFESGRQGLVEYVLVIACKSALKWDPARIRNKPLICRQYFSEDGVPIGADWNPT